jgi:hypothetical protein
MEKLMKTTTVKLEAYKKVKPFKLVPEKPWSAKKCTIEHLKGCLIDTANALEAISEKDLSQGVWRVIKKINKRKD